MEQSIFDQVNRVTPDALQPDYDRWNQVSEGMTRSEVEEILGPPLEDDHFGTTDAYWSYGYIQHVFVPHPRFYRFYIGFAEDGRVWLKQDPFGGVLSTDGLPTPPEIITPAERQTFSHYPRILDVRWSPSSGEYPISYDIEIGYGHEGLFHGGIAASGFYPTYHLTEWTGAQPGRIRIRGTNKLGTGEWSDYRYFEFTV